MDSAIHKFGPLPLVIGVTGHRDLRPDDIAMLEERVRTILLDLRARYPATPLVLLSPLAEGADRLVARIAIRMDVRLIVPLPMAKEDYAQDFEADESKAEFETLLAQADRSFELSLVEDNLADATDEIPHRVKCYALVGAYIARHSQILLALWDGADSKKPAGTSQIVRFKLEGVPEPYAPRRSPLDPVESGQVFHLVTPRMSNPETVGKPFQLLKLYPKGYHADSEAEGAHHRILKRMNGFNTDAIQLSSGLTQLQDREKSYALPASVADEMPTPIRAILNRYALASSLAMHYQRQTFWTLRSVLFLVFLAAVFFQTYSFWQPKPLVLGICYVVTLCLGYALYLQAGSWCGDFHNKYLDYRALAEGLRVLLFWRLAGLRQSVAEHYLRRQRSELDWIRQAIRVWTIPVKSETGQSEIAKARPEWLKTVHKQWVEDQKNFFTRTVRRDRIKARVIRVLGYGFFLAGVILAVIKVWVDSNSPILLAMGLTMVIAALLHEYSRTMGYSEHAAQYERMSEFYSTGSRLLHTMLEDGQLTQAQALIKELGQEALMENGDWLMFHRRLPVKPPGSGA